MDTALAFMKNQSALASGARPRVFDWDKAAELIRDRRPSVAGAGLQDDWEWTGGRIYADGKPVPRDETYTFLASNWATPELELDGEVIECWKYVDETDGWDSGTYWPDSALKILEA